MRGRPLLVRGVYARGSIPLVWSFLGYLGANCSLVVGDLPEPLSVDGGTITGPSLGGDGDSSTSSEPTDAAGGEGPAAGGNGNASSSGSPDAADAQGTPVLDAADQCDRDGDGEQSEECGGGDCDDYDGEVFSTQAEYFDVVSERRGFDYNCDGNAERSEPTLTCADDLALCDTTMQGFVDEPPPQCGQEGSWGECVLQGPGGLMCQPQVNEMRRVACR
jgi:hypothetical protein